MSQADPCPPPPRLSVNLNKVALLRNARHNGIPDVAAFVPMARAAGASGITLHPRPDARHVRRDDVDAVAAAMAPWRPGFELNIEGFPDDRLASIVEACRPEQCTLVPDAPEAFTSDRGWRFTDGENRTLRAWLPRLRAAAGRVVLFVEPDAGFAEAAASLGADGIEIYTGGYAEAHARGDACAPLAACAGAARAARERGLLVNVGHDLDLGNIPPLVAAAPGLHEASIGHALTADALVHGFAATVARYRDALASGTR